MANKLRGTSSMIRLMRAICHFVRAYGVAGMAIRTSPAIAAALTALDAACRAWEEADDQPGETDVTPGGYEDDPDNS